jgi:hypothetical protein
MSRIAEQRETDNREGQCHCFTILVGPPVGPVQPAIDAGERCPVVKPGLFGRNP